MSSPTTFIQKTYKALRRCSIPKHRMNNPKLLFICHCQLRDTLPPCLEIWHCCNNNLHPHIHNLQQASINRWKYSDAFWIIHCINNVVMVTTAVVILGVWVDNVQSTKGRAVKIPQLWMNYAYGLTIMAYITDCMMHVEHHHHSVSCSVLKSEGTRS